jgi:hypothetical protein
MLMKLETIYSLIVPLPSDVGTRLDCFGAIHHQFRKEFCSQKVISQAIASLKYSYARIGIYRKRATILFSEINHQALEDGKCASFQIYIFTNTG